MPSPLSSDRRRPWVPVAIISLVVLLLVGVLGTHPQLSRREAIDAAMSQQLQQTRHHAAKLVRESDLERAVNASPLDRNGLRPQWGHNDGPDFFVWVSPCRVNMASTGIAPTADLQRGALAS